MLCWLSANLEQQTTEADLALAHHVAHVHRFGAPPVPEFRFVVTPMFINLLSSDLTADPVDPEFMRAYIARSRKIGKKLKFSFLWRWRCVALMRALLSKEPFIPRDLTEYIVRAYVNMRSEEVNPIDHLSDEVVCVTLFVDRPKLKIQTPTRRQELCWVSFVFLR